MATTTGALPGPAVTTGSPSSRARGSDDRPEHHGRGERHAPRPPSDAGPRASTATTTATTAATGVRESSAKAIGEPGTPHHQNGTHSRDEHRTEQEDAVEEPGHA